MKTEDRIKELAKKKREITRFTNELDEKLRTKKISKRKYALLLKKQYGGKHKEHLMKEIQEEIRKLKEEYNRKQQKRKIQLAYGLTILILLGIISIFTSLTPQTPTGYTARETQATMEYGITFDHYTEAELNITNITSLMISGELKGTRATVKLRINDNEYIVADIKQEEPSLITGLVIEEEYTLSTDKTEYAIGETAYIIITPQADNKSLYINYQNETHKLEGDTYITENIGEHQVIALIVLPDDILRLETSFTVINVTTNKTVNITLNETINETINATVNETINESTNATNETTKTFENLCVETCNIIETSNPILIVELEENTTLTITEITVVQNKENKVPKQTKTIPDITINTKQTASLNLDEYFTDPDGDTIHYDINEIPEISATIKQETLTINSDQTGIYTAYIYATDGDKLVTSNTFQIKITETNISEYPPETNITETNITTNETTNITSNETIIQPEITPITTDPCSHPDINQRPSYCFVGIEEKAFEDLTVSVQNKKRARVGLFTRFGNLIIKGLLIQNTTGRPDKDDFEIGFSETIDFTETRTSTAWIDTKTGNLYLKGRIHENQEILNPSQFNTLIIRNKFGMILGYFDEIKGDLYLRGNIVQLGKV